MTYLSIDGDGFADYNVIEVTDIIDLGDSYNIVAETREMFWDKKYCSVYDDGIVFNNNAIRASIEYGM